MTTSPAPSDEETTWRRRFASRANNRGWELSEQPTRTPAEDAEMLHAAHACAHLWEPIATDRQRAHADLLLAQVHALLGHTEPAWRHARAAFVFITKGESDPWEFALAHAIVAHAACRRSDDATHRSEYATAKSLIDAIEDQEEKDILLATFRVIPPPAA